jgi:hypothetical protein
MSTQQPEYKYLGHFGDTDPVAYGGGFVYTDATGVYRPWAEYIEPATEDEAYERFAEEMKLARQR